MQKVKLVTLDVVTAADANYEKKVEELSFREEAVAKREAAVDEREEDIRILKSGIQAEIKIRANQKVQGSIAKSDKQYKEKESQLQHPFECMKAGYKRVFLGALVYGILITIFEAIKTNVLREEVVEFFIALCNGLIDCSLNLWKIVISGAFVGGIAILIFKAGNMLVKHISHKMMDEITISFMLGVMAVLVFFAESISSLIPTNMVILYLLIMAVCLIVRSVMGMGNVQARKVLIVNVGCGLLILFALWIGFKMMVYGLSALSR